MTRHDHSAEREHSDDAEARLLLSATGYQQLRRTVVMATASVALIPLFVLTLVHYNHYQETLEDTQLQGISRLLTNNKRSLEFFLAERMSALSYLIRDRSYQELCEPGALGRIMRNMNQSFALGAFVDLGVIDAAGAQRCYEGPFDLSGRSYRDQEWFRQARRHGRHVSEVFLGFRNSPHFAIATRHTRQDGVDFVLRATFDAEMLRQQIHSAGLGLHDDIFLTDRSGTLQTPSRKYGEVLKQVPLDPPHNAPGVEVFRHADELGQAILLGYANIAGSPFVLVFVKPAREGGVGWQVSARLLGFLCASTVLILAVILWGSSQFVRRIRAENERRAKLMHNVEYNNKLASIGRLAAGVAHEINNPLAVINEKTGLLQDLISMRGEEPARSKYLALTDSVLASVSRCKTITHRLLGFAKRMDIGHEELDISALLEEVVGFLHKEAEYRSITLSVSCQDVDATVVSDRGQLQQVFVNLINNAIGAVSDGGEVKISIKATEGGPVSVLIADNGIGIPKENLGRIFEPFFTTKEGSGTGLGLSITHGIVQRLGGTISVDSQVSQGTCFTVTLPRAVGEQHHG